VVSLTLLSSGGVNVPNPHNSRLRELPTKATAQPAFFLLEKESL
jgi:hypothetical protein